MTLVSALWTEDMSLPTYNDPHTHHKEVYKSLRTARWQPLGLDDVPRSVRDATVTDWVATDCGMLCGAQGSEPGIRAPILPTSWAYDWSGEDRAIVAEEVRLIDFTVT